MKLGEHMSYLQGLIDGLDIDTSTKEGKALTQMADVMQEMVLYIDDLQSQVNELSELCDILDSDLGDVEEDFYDFDEDECGCGCEDLDDDSFDFDSDELYEVCCPSCGDTVVLDEGMLEEGYIDCPNCGENLEFDFDDIELADADDSEE